MLEYWKKLPLSLTSQTLLLGLTIGIISYKLLQKKYKLPPGPRGLPVLGSILTFMRSGNTMYKQLAKWKKDYGPIITFYMGPIRMIGLSSTEVVREALVTKGAEFSGRIKAHSVQTLTDNYKSIVATDATPTWKLQRKLALQGLRQYLSGNKMGEKIFESTNKVMKLIREKDGEAIDIKNYMSLVVFNLLHGVCFSKRFELNDELFIELLEHIDTFGNEIGSGVFEDVVPLLKYWPTKRFNRIIGHFQSFVDFVRSEFNAHKEHFNGDNLKDITDFLINARRQAAVDDPSIEDLITDSHLVNTLADVFGAGVDTSRQSLSWTIFLLCENPEVQRKAQEEIDQVLDIGQVPSLQDRDRLPYTEAVLHESLRMCSPAPIGVPHCTTCDTTIGGYEIPKGTAVFTNLWALHMDPEAWGDPEVFRPERFLDRDGKMAPKTSSWLPFSAGRRNCLGETIARPELHLIISILLRNFTFSKGQQPQGQQWTMNPLPSGFVFVPPSNYVLALPRQ